MAFAYPSSRVARPVASLSTVAAESSAEGFLRVYRNVIADTLDARAGSILREVVAFPPTTSNHAVAAIFESNPGLSALPIVDDARPLGLLNRQHFFTMLSRRYYRELYEHGPCTSFMDAHPLVVETCTPVSELLDRIIDAGDTAIGDGFIIVEDGAYAGIGLARDVLRLVATAQAAYARSLTQARKAVEEQEARAEALVAERTRQLEIARQEALHAAHLKGEFLAHMSHEIRTPLNGVLGLAEIGRDQATDPRSRLTFERIMQSGRLLLGVVDDVLDFSKIEAGKLTIEAQRVALNELLDRVIGNQAEAAGGKGLVLALAKTTGLPACCLIDPLRLEQILTNLLANAIKFTDKGRVKLTVEAGGDRLCLTVADTGIGMNAEQVARVFSPFEQADNSTTRRFGGTGLGLTITRRLVELMGGEISVTSAPEQGSRFTVVLPFVTANGAVPNEATAAIPPLRGERLDGLHLLVADDNEINRIVVEGLLTAAGATACFTCDGSEAIAAVANGEADEFSLVLMDLQMPEVNGYEATRRIRELAPELPIVALTAHALVEERARCLAAGMVDVVTKPIDARRLADVIGRHGRRPASKCAPAPGAPPPECSAVRIMEPVRLNRNALTSAYGTTPGMLDRVCASFLRSYRQTPELLRTAAARNDFTAVAHLAHKTRSALGFLMATASTEIAAEIELAARNGDHIAIALTARLADDIGQLCAEIDEWMQHAS